VDGPFYSLLPERLQARWRKIGHDVYRTVGGYVTGNLLISLIAGTLTTIVLLASGVPYAVALGGDRRDPRPDPTGGRDDRSDHHRDGRVPAHDHGGDRGHHLLPDLPAGRDHFCSR